MTAIYAPLKKGTLKLRNALSVTAPITAPVKNFEYQLYSEPNLQEPIYSITGHYERFQMC